MHATNPPTSIHSNTRRGRLNSVEAPATSYTFRKISLLYYRFRLLSGHAKSSGHPTCCFAARKLESSYRSVTGHLIEARGSHMGKQQHDELLRKQRLYMDPTRSVGTTPPYHDLWDGTLSAYVIFKQTSIDSSAESAMLHFHVW